MTWKLSTLSIKRPLIDESSKRWETRRKYQCFYSMIFSLARFTVPCNFLSTIQFIDFLPETTTTEKMPGMSRNYAFVFKTVTYLRWEFNRFTLHWEFTNANACSFVASVYENSNNLIRFFFDMELWNSC